jgi:hypothetical protein
MKSPKVFPSFFEENGSLMLTIAFSGATKLRDFGALFSSERQK